MAAWMQPVQYPLKHLVSPAMGPKPGHSPYRLQVCAYALPTLAPEPAVEGPGREEPEVVLELGGP